MRPPRRDDYGGLTCIKAQFFAIADVMLFAGKEERLAGDEMARFWIGRKTTVNEYVKCTVCGEQVDRSVPKAFCGFCSITPSASCPWTKPVATTTLFVLGVHTAGPVFHDKGGLVRTDLPREHLEHIEQSSANSVVSLGAGATVQVLGTSTAVLPPGAPSFPSVLRRAPASKLFDDDPDIGMPLPLRVADDQ